MTSPRTRNPFDRFELDPRSDVESITEALRERATDAHDEAERAEARRAWESLTLHAETRLALALTAVPETRAPLGAPPRAAALPGSRVAAEPLGLLDLLDPPSLREALDRTLGPEDDEERALWAPRRTREG